MKDELAKYLSDAEWTRPVEQKRFWKSGPAKWIAEAVRQGILPLLAMLMLTGAMLTLAGALLAPPASAATCFAAVTSDSTELTSA